MSEEIDRAVALEVMGWTSPRSPLALESYRDAKGVSVLSWKPSTDIADAWRVVERADSLGLDYQLSRARRRRVAPEESWCAIFYGDGQDIHEVSHADTAPEAICRAALAAVRAMKGAEA